MCVVIPTSCEKTYPTWAGNSITSIWVPIPIPIFHDLDNAGGHGMGDAIKKCVVDIESDHNVICIH